MNILLILLDTEAMVTEEDMAATDTAAVSVVTDTATAVVTDSTVKRLPNNNFQTSIYILFNYTIL